MFTNKLIITLLISILFIQFYMIYKVYNYKKTIERKNIKLIQFYLDMKFIWKGILDNLNISDTAEFCRKLIIDIKEYYNLDDLIIVDSIAMVKDEKNTPLRNAVINDISDKIDNIIIALENQNFITEYLEFNDKSYILYISPITPDVVNDGLIVCVERRPSLLSEHEKISLENSVNLLKTRLMYN